MKGNQKSISRLYALLAITTVLGFVPGTLFAATYECMLEPMRSTNMIGASRSITATVTSNGVPLSGVTVHFRITQGPHDATGTSTTGPAGTTAFTYTGTSSGTDILQATGSVAGTRFTCNSTQLWVNLPTITCPGNITTNTTTGECDQQVSFSATASGTPMPTVRYRLGDTPINSPHRFPAGVNVVTVSASNANGVATCTFNVVVQEVNPPVITCPGDQFFLANPGEGGAIVEYEPAGAEDDCGDVTLTADVESGTFFALGTTTVTYTATDRAGNTSTCSFNVTVEEGVPEPHDLAIVKMKVPRYVPLFGGQPATRRVTVTIQNRSSHAETIDPATFESLVTLQVQPINPEACADIVPELLFTKPQKLAPFTVKSRGKFNIHYNVTFECYTDGGRGPGLEDYRFIATVNHAAIDGNADSHPECDTCPRAPLEGAIDPYPNGRVRDKGCGASLGGGFFGGDVLTDLFLR